MWNRLFRLLVAFSMKHPMTIIVVAGLLTLVSLFLIFYLSIDTDITTLLPKNSPVVKTLEEALRTFKSFDFLFVVLEAEEPGQGNLLIQAAETLAPALANPAYIFAVDYSLDPRLQNYYLEAKDNRLSCLLSREDLNTALSRLSPEELGTYLLRLSRHLQGVASPEETKRLLEDPLDLGSLFLRRLMISRGPIPFQLRKGYFLSQDEKMLLMILKPLEPSSNLKFSTELMNFLSRVREALIDNRVEFHGKVKVSFLGSHAEAVADTQIVRRDLFQTLISSFIMVLLLFFLVFRRRESIIFVGVPLFIGILWTLGLTRLVIGHLTVVTFSFGAVLIGLGIDFAIHIYSRFLEEYQAEERPSVYKALHTALIRTGGGVFLGAVTTAVAFYGMFLTSFPGFRELGFVAGSGILCCLISIFFLLPVLIRYVTPRDLPRHGLTKTTFGLSRLFPMIMEYPRLVLILGLVISVYFAYQARFVRFDEEFRAFKQPSRSYTEMRRNIGVRFSLPSQQIIAIVSDSTLQGVLEQNDRLYDNLERQKGYPILSCDTLRTFMPSLKTQRESKRMISESIGERFDRIKTRVLRQGKQAGLSPAAFEPFFRRLEQLINAAREEKNFIVYEEMNDPFIIQLVQGYLVRDYYVSQSHLYKVVTKIFPPDGQWTGGVPEAFLNTLRQGVQSVEFTGGAIVAGEIQSIVKKDLAAVILIVIGAVFLILLLYYGWVHRTVFAILPVACGCLWMLGTIHILGIELNILNVVVIPMIIGVGVDNGIHLIGRYYERGENPTRVDLQKAVERTGHALVMTSLTTIMGFGSLSLAEFRGIREMGLLSIFGIAYTLIASLVFLPALLKIWGRRHRFSDFIGRDEGEIR